MSRDEVDFCVFISGYGRGAIDLLSRLRGLQDNGKRLRLIVSTSSQFTQLQLAEKADVSVEWVLLEDFCDRNLFEQKLLSVVEKYNIKHLFLAGFKYLLSGYFIKEFGGKILNIHPSLLPSFKGHKNAIQQALSAGVKVTGVTIHAIDTEMDKGTILYQTPVTISCKDNFQSVDKKIFSCGAVMSYVAILEQFD